MPHTGSRQARPDNVIAEYNPRFSSHVRSDVRAIAFAVDDAPIFRTKSALPKPLGIVRILVDKSGRSSGDQAENENPSRRPGLDVLPALSRNWSMLPKYRYWVPVYPRFARKNAKCRPVRHAAIRTSVVPKISRSRIPLPIKSIDHLDHDRLRASESRSILLDFLETSAEDLPLHPDRQAREPRLICPKCPCVCSWSLDNGLCQRGPYTSSTKARKRCTDVSESVSALR